MIEAFDYLFSAILLFLLVIVYVLVEYWYVVILTTLLGTVFVLSTSNKAVKMTGIIFLLSPSSLVIMVWFDVFNGRLTFFDILEKIGIFLSNLYSITPI